MTALFSRAEPPHTAPRLDIPTRVVFVAAPMSTPDTWVLDLLGEVAE